MKRGTIAALAIVGGVGVVACSSTTTKPSPPSPGTYTISFQSTAQAVATESVELFVYDAADASDLCFTLISLRNSNQELPAALVKVDPTPVCSLQCATPPCASGTLDVPFSTVAVLAIATRGGMDVARGCAMQSFSASNTNVTVLLSQVPGTAIPTTTCQTLGDHCKGGC